MCFYARGFDKANGALKLVIVAVTVHGKSLKRMAPAFSGASITEWHFGRDGHAVVDDTIGGLDGGERIDR